MISKSRLPSKDRARVLIAGIGGASLGTEILKCLVAANRYTIFGCDISEYAYGHYQDGVSETFVVSRDSYIESVLERCLAYEIAAIIPGGEEPLRLLTGAADTFQQAGILIAANSPNVTAVCSDKQRLIERLRELDLPVPWTIAVEDEGRQDEAKIPAYPCVIKPATGTGGSASVFLASNRIEAEAYIKSILTEGKTALVQEYLPLEEGEISLAVLSLPDGQVAGSVGMRKIFDCKLSVSLRTKDGLIASPYSQGLIDEFSEVRVQAEQIASALGSTGPLNIQGRLRHGTLIPFEINPRFSGGIYLRALAGFNEIDTYLRYVLDGTQPTRSSIRPGYYLRSLAELYVPMEGIKR